MSSLSAMLIKLFVLILVDLSHGAAIENNLRNGTFRELTQEHNISTVADSSEDPLLPSTEFQNMSINPVPSVVGGVKEMNVSDPGALLYAPAFPLPSFENASGNDADYGGSGSYYEMNDSDPSTLIPFDSLSTETIVTPDTNSETVSDTTEPESSAATLDVPSSQYIDNYTSVLDVNESTFLHHHIHHHVSKAVNASSHAVRKAIAKSPDSVENSKGVRVTRNFTDFGVLNLNQSSSSVTNNENLNITGKSTHLPETTSLTLSSNENYSTVLILDGGDAMKSTETLVNHSHLGVTDDDASYEANTIASLFQSTSSQTLVNSENTTAGMDVNVTQTVMGESVKSNDMTESSIKPLNISEGDTDSNKIQVSSTVVPESTIPEVEGANKKGRKPNKCAISPLPFCPAHIPENVYHEVTLKFFILRNTCAQYDVPKIFEGYLRKALDDWSCTSVQRLSFTDSSPYVFKFTDANPNNTICGEEGSKKLKLKMFNGSEICSNFSKGFLPLFKIASIDVVNLYACSNPKAMSKAMWAIVAVIIVSILPCLLIGLFKFLHVKYLNKPLRHQPNIALQHRRPLVLMADLQSFRLKDLMKIENSGDSYKKVESHTNMAFDEHENVV